MNYFSITLLITTFLLTSSLNLSEKSNKKEELKMLKISKLKKSNSQVFQYIQEIEYNFENKNWDTIISSCLSDYFEEQIALGITKNQFIYELFNMKPIIKSEVDVNYLELVNASLAQIKEFSTLKFGLLNTGTLGNTYLFEGVITLENSQKFNFSYTLIELNKSYKLLGAFG